MGMPMPVCKYCFKEWHFESVDGDYGYLVKSCRNCFWRHLFSKLKIKRIKNGI